MYHLYVLYSTTACRHYISSSDNLEHRLRRHNSGSVRSTKAYRPWKIVGTEPYKTKTEARKREIFLKKNARARDEVYTKYGPIV